jgi:hypothetical protein
MSRKSKQKLFCFFLTNPGTQIQIKNMEIQTKILETQSKKPEPKSKQKKTRNFCMDFRVFAWISNWPLVLWFLIKLLGQNKTRSQKGVEKLPI